MAYIINKKYRNFELLPVFYYNEGDLKIMLISKKKRGIDGALWTW
ncbi:MAG: hypothetical protein ACOX0G_02980 [Patescibacteria group bacterium]